MSTTWLKSSSCSACVDLGGEDVEVFAQFGLQPGLHLGHVGAGRHQHVQFLVDAVEAEEALGLVQLEGGHRLAQAGVGVGVAEVEHADQLEGLGEMGPMIW